MIPVLWLSGPPGVGKTAVAWEIYGRLQRTGAHPAYVDVDQLGICYPPGTDDPDRHAIKARNVAALRANFAASGARTLIVSGAVDARRGPDVETLGGPHIVVARLRADPDALRARLRRRHGSFAPHEAALQEAEALDRSIFADWCIDTSGLSIDEAATRALREIGDWPSGGDERPDSSAADIVMRAQVGGEVLWLSGTAGVGKSTVGFRAYLDVLRSGGHAAYVDVDQIGFCSTARSDHSLRARNLAAMCSNFHDAGARLVVVVGRVFTRSEARLYEQALPNARFSWCRLQVGDAELTRRILSRGEGGSWAQPGDPLRDQSRDELLAVAERAIAAGPLLDQHDNGLRIDVDGLDVEDAAERLLKLARWPSGVAEQQLDGGIANAGKVVRVGRHVLRPSSPHTRSIHAFLRAVRHAGFEGASFPVGVDEDGRERLVFIDGDVPVAPYPDWSQTDTALASIAGLLRGLHDAARGFDPRGFTWDDALADPAGGTLVCHNDLEPSNIVFRDGIAVALLDFEFAAPGRPVYDLAHLARLCVPIDDDFDQARLGWRPADRPARLRLVADAYGLDRDGRAELLTAVDDAIDRIEAATRRGVDAGDPSSAEMWNRTGGSERFDRRRRWWTEHHDEFAAALL